MSDEKAPPVLDVIIPHYGGTDITWRCLTHLWLFSPPGVRITVVDDCSPDNMPAIGAWLQKSGLARYHRHEKNRGVTAGWNTGLKLTEDNPAPLVGFMNNDAAVMPGTVAALIYCANSGIEVVCANERIGDPNEGFEPGRLLLKETPQKFTFVQNFLGGFFVVNRERLEKIGRFDERFRQGCSDFDFLLRMGLDGARIRVVNEAPLYHGGTISSKRMGLMKAMAQYKHDLEAFRAKWKDSLREEARMMLRENVPFEVIIAHAEKAWAESPLE